MILYIVNSDNPQGGYYHAEEKKPDMRIEHEPIREIKMIEDFPDDVWRMILQGAGPVDADGTNDPIWVEWWQDPRAQTVWVR